MKTGPTERLGFVVLLCLVSVWIVYSALEAFTRGAPTAAWLPELTFGVLFPLGYYVPALSTWDEADAEQLDSFTLWDWATTAVYASWAVVGVLFLLLGYLRVLVVVSTLLGVGGVVAMWLVRR